MEKRIQNKWIIHVLPTNAWHSPPIPLYCWICNEYFSLCPSCFWEKFCFSQRHGGTKIQSLTVVCNDYFSPFSSSALPFRSSMPTRACGSLMFLQNSRSKRNTASTWPMTGSNMCKSQRADLPGAGRLLSSLRRDSFWPTTMSERERSTISAPPKTICSKTAFMLKRLPMN